MKIIFLIAFIYLAIGAIVTLVMNLMSAFGFKGWTFTDEYIHSSLLKKILWELVMAITWPMTLYFIIRYVIKGE